VLCFFLGIIGMIVQGAKGNEWAWQYRRWESIEQFKQTERLWIYAGDALLILSFVVGGIIGAMNHHYRGQRWQGWLLPPRRTPDGWAAFPGCETS